MKSFFPPRCRKLAGAFLCAAALAGCASNGNRHDPLEPINRGIYHFNDALDKAVIKPVATGYKTVMPQPVQTGVTNFFSNVEDLLIAVNDALQLKIRLAFSDAGRVAVNSTLGILGLFDVASRMGLEKRNEDFGQTLGRWGVGSGPYLMLPFFGPSTVRDTLGLTVNSYYDPLVNSIHDVPERNRALGLKIVSKRASLLDAEKVLDQAALDPYVFLRDAYLQRRRSLIYDGNPPPEPEEEDEEEEGTPQKDAEPRETPPAEAPPQAPAGR